jgi:hypothetical protein
MSAFALQSTRELLTLLKFQFRERIPEGSQMDDYAMWRAGLCAVCRGEDSGEDRHCEGMSGLAKRRPGERKRRDRFGARWGESLFSRESD